MLKKLVHITLLTIILSLISVPNTLYASEVTPANKSYTLNSNDFTLDQLTYTNDTSKDEKLTLTVSAYDAKNEQTLTDKPFLAIKSNTLIAKAKSQTAVEYAISIPKDTPQGTYFNVIYFQKGDTNTTTGVGVVPTIGVLVTIHVQDSTTTLNKIFYDQSDIKLVVKQKGLPYISDLKFEYTYTNNSKFVFKPEGEIRLIDSKDQQISERFEINPDKKAIYPGESITQEFSVKAWKDIKSILTSKSIVSKTYSDIDQTPVLNKIDISIMYQVGVIGVVGIILILVLIYTIGYTIFTIFKPRKEK